MKTFFWVLLNIAMTSTLLANENYNGTWFGTFANKKLDNKLSFWLETQVRYNLNFGNTSQVLYRTGILQNSVNGKALGYLYAYIQSSNSREHRFTLQHTNSYGEYSGLSFSHRARFETRNLEQTSRSFESSMRARYLLRTERNLETFFNFVIWDQVFLNLNNTSWNGNQTFDRNRFFLGFKRKFFSTNRAEFGYLNQFIPRESGDITEHIATIYFFF